MPSFLPNNLIFPCPGEGGTLPRRPGKISGINLNVKPCFFQHVCCRVPRFICRHIDGSICRYGLIVNCKSESILHHDYRIFFWAGHKKPAGAGRSGCPGPIQRAFIGSIKMVNDVNIYDQRDLRGNRQSACRTDALLSQGNMHEPIRECISHQSHASSGRNSSSPKPRMRVKMSFMST